MKRLFRAACVLAFIAVTCTAYVAAEEEEEPSFDVVVENESKRVGGDAILVGRLLLEAARQIELDEELKSGNDEYFIRKLWNKTMGHIRNIKEAANNTISKAKATITTAARQAFEKVKQRAYQTLAKIFSNTVAGYAVGDYETQSEFVTAFCARVKEVGQGFIEKGNKLKGQ